MINLRYHIVSLTAVFLALIIGILMGTTVVSKATVDGLRSNLQRAEVRSEAVHDRNSELTKELGARKLTDAAVNKALTEQALLPAVEGTLQNVPVLIIASSAATGDTLRNVITSLNDAGADVDGTLVLDDRLSAGKLDRQKLATILGVDPASDLVSALAKSFAATLVAAANPGSKKHSTVTTTLPSDTTATSDVTTSLSGESTTTTTTLPPVAEPDLVTALRKAGYLDFRPLEGHASDGKVLESPNFAQGIGYRYVFVSGANPSVADADFLMPLIARLAKAGSVPMVATSAPTKSTGEDREVFLKPLLDVAGVKGHISTVDNIESFSGMVALAFALDNAQKQNFGTFGVGSTATAVLPPYRP